MVIGVNPSNASLNSPTQVVTQTSFVTTSHLPKTFDITNNPMKTIRKSFLAIALVASTIVMSSAAAEASYRRGWTHNVSGGGGSYCNSSHCLVW